MQPYMEFCFHVWKVVPSCYLDMLDKLQKRICGTVVHKLAAYFKRLAHRREVASLSLFY